MYKRFDSEVKQIIDRYKEQEKKLKDEIKAREEAIIQFQDEIKQNQKTMESEGIAILTGKKKAVFGSIFKSTKRAKAEIEEDIEVAEHEKEFFKLQLLKANGILKESILKMVDDLEGIESKYNEIYKEKAARLNEIEIEKKELEVDINRLKYENANIRHKCVEGLRDILSSVNEKNIYDDRRSHTDNKQTQYEICMQFHNIAFERVRELANKDI